MAENGGSADQQHLDCDPITCGHMFEQLACVLKIYHLVPANMEDDVAAPQVLVVGGTAGQAVRRPRPADR